jgi:hypothetical protein
MGRADLIGNGKAHLIPSFQPKGTFDTPEKTQTFKTKYTGFGNNKLGSQPSRPSKSKSRAR